MAKKPSATRLKRSAGKSKDLATRLNGRSMNQGLSAARSAKKDEFYTQYVDIQKEVEAYLEFDEDTFRDKVVYCNCDDPFESNFFKYFAANFNKLGLKKLISTSYDGSPIAGQATLFPEYEEDVGQRPRPQAIAVIVDRVTDENGDGAADVTDVELFLKRNKAARVALKSNGEHPGGDFRSSDCLAFLKEADIVVTNPPFSLFREYIGQLLANEKKFLIIGNTNSITYKDIFPHIKNEKVWLGCTNFNVGMYFEVPDNWKQFHHIDQKTGKKIARVSTSCWYTSLDHGRRHQPLSLMTMRENERFNRKLGGRRAYEAFENYDAIEVPYYDAIPSDYDGIMGVPITFLDKYSPEQFEILWQASGNTRASSPKTVLDEIGYVAHPEDRGGCAILSGQRKYGRIFIRHRRSKG